MDFLGEQVKHTRWLALVATVVLTMTAIERGLVRAELER